MSMLRTWLIVCLCLGVAQRVRAADDTEAAEESAGEEEEESTNESAPVGKTLAERIPSVTHRVFMKKGRVELFPAIGGSLNDPFFNNLTLSGGLTFHVLESFGIGVNGDYFLALKSKVPIAGGGGLVKPQVNRPVYAARLELTWAPLYGKISVLAEKVLHFDFYAIGGAGVVAGSKSSPTVAGIVGLGQHYFFNDWMALKIELRDQFFAMSREALTPTKDKHLQGLLSASVGVCFYLPSEIEREAL
jgi:outer membrane beta-barrel protein